MQQFFAVPPKHLLRALKVNPEPVGGIGRTSDGLKVEFLISALCLHASERKITALFWGREGGDALWEREKTEPTLGSKLQFCKKKKKKWLVFVKGNV